MSSVPLLVLLMPLFVHNKNQKTVQAANHSWILEEMLFCLSTAPHSLPVAPNADNTVAASITPIELLGAIDLTAGAGRAPSVNTAALV